ncbi:hypothetical protein TNCV_4940131 [Trichonephila clavipes]|nr:hypothetical protein TNCV_4940131 [Trichonephila clavipes]
MDKERTSEIHQDVFCDKEDKPTLTLKMNRDSQESPGGPFGAGPFFLSMFLFFEEPFNYPPPMDLLCHRQATGIHN